MQLKKQNNFWKIKLYFSVFLYVANAFRKRISNWLPLKNVNKFERETRINSAFFNIKNLNHIFKKLEEFSIRSYRITLINKFPILFLKNDTLFIRVLQKRMSPRENFFTDSFEILSKLYTQNSYNFPPPYKCIEDDSFMYYIIGKADASRLNKNTYRKIKKLSTENKAILLKQIIDILKLLSKLKIVHGDISKNNILFDKKKT